MEYFTLYNGVRIPAIGFGTGIAKGLRRRPLYVGKIFIKEKLNNLKDPEFKEKNQYPVLHDLKKDISLQKVAIAASEHGCRLFDTARAYQYSEEYLANALWGGRHDTRKQYFVISKITNQSQREGRVRECFEESLKKLRTDYLDLCLIHWPQTDTWLDAWRVLEELYMEGKVRAIGVSNCHVHHLETLRNFAEIQPMANEVECHPMLPQNEIREYCKMNNIQMIAYAPTGKMNRIIAENERIMRACNKYSASPSQVVLRWHYQLGDISIPNTTNINHVKDNLDIWNFELDKEEIAAIGEIECDYRIWPDPDHCNFDKL